MATQCKVLTHRPQTIPPATWTPIRFDEVLRNDGGMFAADAFDDPAAALITPYQDGDFVWSRFVHWDTSPPQPGVQFIEQFCRDPYGVPDTTASADGGDTAGREFRLGTWQFRGRAGQAVAVRVWHDHPEPVAILHAQFVATTWDY